MIFYKNNYNMYKVKQENSKVYKNKFNKRLTVLLNKQKRNDMSNKQQMMNNYKQNSE